jgi:hypothetical protein
MVVKYQGRHLLFNRNNSVVVGIEVDTITAITTITTISMVAVVTKEVTIKGVVIKMGSCFI